MFGAILAVHFVEKVTNNANAPGPDRSDVSTVRQMLGGERLFIRHRLREPRERPRTLATGQCSGVTSNKLLQRPERQREKKDIDEKDHQKKTMVQWRNAVLSFDMQT